jgi:rhodanese-related sulfurtransferase
MKAISSVLLALALPALRAEDKPAKPEPPASTAPAKKYKNVDADTFDKMRKSEKNAVVLDVRTKDEYNQGHIPGAVLVDFTSPDFEKEVSKLDKKKTYLVHCAVGGRSARACKKMDALNFSSVYNLEGGITAWQKAGKPVEK